MIINEDSPTRTAIFIIPEGLLIEHSEYFRAACDRKWKDGQSGVIKISDVEPDTFKDYVFWMYRERIGIGYSSPDQQEGFYSHEAAPVLEDLTRLWLLADRFGDTKLRNECTDDILGVLGAIVIENDNCEDAFTPEMIAAIWLSMTEGRPLRHLVLDYYVYYADSGSLESRFAEFPTRFPQEPTAGKPRHHERWRMQYQPNRSGSLLLS